MDNVGGYQGYHNRLKRTSSELYNQSTPPTNGDGNNNNNGNNGAREQERMMPIANVIRIMRKVLPAHAKISDDAKETIQECVSEYISFITAEANDRCRSEHRKTVTADDLLFSMSKLGFHDYVHPLSLYLRRYRHLEGAADFRGSPRPAPFLHNPPPTTRAYGPMPTTLGGGPMARDLGYGPGGPTWEGGFMNESGMGPSQGPMMMNGFDPYGPPPPYK